MYTLEDFYLCAHECPSLFVGVCANIYGIQTENKKENSSNRLEEEIAGENRDNFLCRRPDEKVFPALLKFKLIFFFCIFFRDFEIKKEKKLLFLNAKMRRALKARIFKCIYDNIKRKFEQASYNAL